MFTAEFHNQTTLHPLSIITLLLLGIAMLLVPRRFALAPLLILALSVGPAQRVVVADLDFTFLRLLVAGGWLRVLLRGETSGFRWKAIDSIVVAWAATSTIGACVLHSTMTSTIYQLGMLYDSIGIYFLCRFVARDWTDLRTFATCAALLAVPVSMAFVVELASAHNLFAVFGGVPTLTEERFGRLRCQGPFPHPIIAGCFWAALMPLIGALWWDTKWNRLLAVVGLAASTIIVISTASSTPASGVILGMVAALAFSLRNWMGWIRWTSAFILVLIQLVMTNAIWHLLSRIDIVAGSTAWYRYLVIDEFVQHFNDWWLIGSRSYVLWWEWGLDDITNHYVAQGIAGGLVPFLLFLGIIVFGFRGVGALIKRDGGNRERVVLMVASRRTSGEECQRHPPARIALIWALGVSLFIHCTVFLGVAYFGQAILGWYLTLGLIGGLTPASAVRQIRFRRTTALASEVYPRLHSAGAFSGAAHP